MRAVNQTPCISISGDLPLFLLVTLLAGTFSGVQAESVPIVLYPPDLTLSSPPVIPLHAVRKEGQSPIRVA
jgi:hypothetical protein